MARVTRGFDRDAAEIEHAAIFVFQIKAFHGLDDPRGEVGEDIHENCSTFMREEPVIGRRKSRPA